MLRRGLGEVRGRLDEQGRVGDDGDGLAGDGDAVFFFSFFFFEVREVRERSSGKQQACSKTLGK